MRWMLPLLILGLASVGCDSDIDEDAFIVDGVLVDTPTGGHNFGELDHFDVASHETDITGINDADGFPFSLSEDSLVVISMESLDGLNGFVEIYDEDGEFIAGDDDSGVSEDALIVGDFEAGDYTIVAWASEEGSYFGDYLLTVLVGSLGADFGVVAPGTGVNGFDVVMDEGVDSQTYIFSLEEDGEVDFFAEQTSGDADLAFQLIDQHGDEVFFFDPPGLDDPEVEAEPLPAGTYMLVVSNDLSAGDGVYDVTIAVVAPPLP